MQVRVPPTQSSILSSCLGSLGMLPSTFTNPLKAAPPLFLHLRLCLWCSASQMEALKERMNQKTGEKKSNFPLSSEQQHKIQKVKGRGRGAEA